MFSNTNHIPQLNPAYKQLSHAAKSHTTADYSSTCCQDAHMKPSTCFSARPTALLNRAWERPRDNLKPTNHSPGWESAGSISCNVHTIGSFPLRYAGLVM